MTDTEAYTLHSLKDHLPKNELESSDLPVADEANQLNLLEMPVEIILNICSFLEANFIKNTLSKVCQRLDTILSDVNLWRYWVQRRIKGRYPPIEDLKIWEDQPLVWSDVCVDMDHEKHKWTNSKKTTRHIVVKDMHIASVDTVLLVNNGELIISGGRDRSMGILNVSELTQQSSLDENGSYIVNASSNFHPPRGSSHTGWVWDLSADNPDAASIVYSGSWDNSVRAWDLATFECTDIMWCKMSVLSVVGCGKEVIAGLYKSKVVLFDLRAGRSITNAYLPHKRAVLGVYKHKELIASLSDDKTMAIWDRVAGKMLMSDIKMPTENAYPVCMSWGPTAMYVGDSKGFLHLFHPETFTLLHSSMLWEQPPMNKPPTKVVGCYQTQGTLITCASKGDIKFMYNCCPPEEYYSVNSRTADITKLSCQNGVMCVGTCDSDLELWVPEVQ